MNATIFWGEVLKPSNDKGPYKGLRVQADEHEFNAQVIESGGYHQSPMTGSQVLVLLPDNDMGKAVIIGGQAPADRVDGQTEGMVTIKNHKNGQSISMDASGNVNINLAGTCSIKADQITMDASTVVVNADMEINGDITHKGNNNQSGIHVDSNGPHTV